jgi:hypothetical protein
MTLSEYLIEAVSKRTTGKYFDFDSLDISSTSYRDLLDAINVSGIPEIPESDAIIISSLMKINKNSDAFKELVNVGKTKLKGKDFMWALWTPEPYDNVLYFFYIENSNRATVWKLAYGSPNSGPKNCIRVTLPSGNTVRDIVLNLNALGDMIKLASK